MYLILSIHIFVAVLNVKISCIAHESPLTILLFAEGNGTNIQLHVRPTNVSLGKQRPCASAPSDPVRLQERKVKHHEVFQGCTSIFLIYSLLKIILLCPVSFSAHSQWSETKSVVRKKAWETFPWRSSVKSHSSLARVTCVSPEKTFK